MSKSQFGILVGLLALLIVVVALRLTPRSAPPPPAVDASPASPPAAVEPSSAPARPDACSVCGRGLVEAHGRLFVKNTTMHHSTIHVRHHPDAPPTLLELDPNGFEIVSGVLVGNSMLRATGPGFDEEAHCTIFPNTQHEMWWTVRGWEAHGMPMQHMGS